MRPDIQRYGGIAQVGFVVLVCVLLAGCTGTPPTERSYSVDSSGVLSVQCPPIQVTETVLSTGANVTISRLVFHTPHGDVFGLLAAPASPKAAFVHAPGAGNKKEGHEGRAVSSAQNGYAYLVLDIRGNGGETPGYPLDFEKDFNLYQKEGFPEYYDTVCDMINAQQYLSSRYDVPVYASGESNGGRYAAVATAIDPGFAGFVGISTSGFGRAGDNPTYLESAKKFLLSIDPDVYIGAISPRSVILFHAPGDPIIPFGDGRKLYDLAKDPKKFFSFNGTHGVNGEVDQVLIAEYTQIYG
ncbi:MAG: alpha/beta hydrolase [Methanomicrobiales archaeon]|nr:alpha/beta hydrolase [Methanomicrobiales archaeon]